MSSNKYANLPDIDTAPDVYETEDVVQSQNNKEDSSDDEIGLHSKSHLRGRNGESHAKPEELDASNLNRGEASKKFRKAEKRRPRTRIQYTYPASPTSSASGRDSPSQHWHPVPKLSLEERIANLKSELEAIEAEVDICNDQEGPHTAADLIRELADVKARLSKAGSSKKDATRGKLVHAVLHVGSEKPADSPADAAVKTDEDERAPDDKNSDEELYMLKFTADIDRRLGTLEKIIGSSSVALDETSPILPPLIVTVTRLHSMLTLLSQPRQLDNVSRRLKLIQPDLERTGNASHAPHTPHATSFSNSQRRQPSGHGLTSSISSNPPASPTVASTQSPTLTRTHLEQLTPILTRLAPILPNIPHILTRLRSLSSLHTNASAFQTTLERLEARQTRERADLADLEQALEGIEKSIQDNEAVVRKNVEDLEAHIGDVAHRIERLDVQG